MVKEQPIYKIDGKNYLITEILICSTSFSNEVDRAVKRFGAIEQGFKDIKRGGLFSSPIIISKILVPVKKIKQWQDAFSEVIK